MSTVRYPRVKVVVAGVTFIPESASIKLPGYFHSATASATISLWGSGPGLADVWWLDLGVDQPIPSVQIYTGYSSTLLGPVDWSTTPLFDGLLDGKELRLHEGLVEINCRDRLALLLDYKVYDAYVNQTGAEVITSLCQAVGLQAQITGAGQKVGTLYGRDFVSLHQGLFSRAQNGADLAGAIARETGNVMYVKGNTLIVAPNQPDAGQAFQVWWGEPTWNANLAKMTVPSNVTAIAVKHNLLVSHDIQVTVRTYHSKTNQGGDYSSTPKTVGSSQRVGAITNRNNDNQQRFLFYYPNLRPDQALAKAQQLYNDLTTHEFILDIEAPADWSVRPYQTVVLSNASGPLSQTFYINDVDFRIGDEGSVMTLNLRNHPPTGDSIT